MSFTHNGNWEFEILYNKCSRIVVIEKQPEYPLVSLSKARDNIPGDSLGANEGSA